MGGETEDRVSGWTTDTLRAAMLEGFAHLEDILDERDRRYQQRFEAQERSLISALDAAEKATTKAETASERRFEGVNEFRAQLSDQASTFMPRAETTLLVEGLASRVSALEVATSAGGGRGQGIAQAWGILIGVIGIIGVATAVVVALAR